MKKIFAVLILIGTITACATTQTLDPNYQAYLSEIAAQREAPREPLLYLTLDSNGLVRDLKVNLPPDRVQILPYKPEPHPGWQLAGTIVKGAVTVAGIGIVADAIEDIVAAGGHNNYYQDSFNQVGRDYNSIREVQLAKGDFAPTWDYSTVNQDSFNTTITDSFRFGSDNSYNLGGQGAALTIGDTSWALGAPWGFLE